MAETNFEGFPADFFTFFTELAQNNRREWFHEHKPRFSDSVISPLQDFVTAMGPRLDKITPYYLADPRRNGGSIFRIYRNLRFSRDKTPYKTHGACQFRHQMNSRDVHAPGFYVHLAPHEVFVGGGIWMPPPDALFKIRTAITEKPDAWKKVINSRNLKAQCGGVSGDGLKRPPRGFSADHPNIEDIKRKSFFAMRHLPPESALEPEFIDEVEKSLKTAAPLVAFLNKALDLPF